jgi:hypothetical protein
MSQLMINKNYWCTLNPEYSTFCEWRHFGAACNFYS